MARFINLIINSILLSIVYLVGVGLTSIIAKLFGKKFIEAESKKTYWSKADQKENIEDYYRQF